MKEAQPKAIYLSEYQPPAYLIESTDLDFVLEEGVTQVSCKILCVKNPSGPSDDNLVLHGEELDLISVAIDGEQLSTRDYAVDDKTLTIFDVPPQFMLETVVTIQPHLNKSLEGLYQSRTMYCTQCEAEGFRKICYYLDRPDVLAKFTTRIEANKSQFPVLLSNGNLIKSGDLKDGRHFAIWQDPFPKPAYLFALVAGKLSTVKDRFVTCSGKTVDIELFVEPKDIDKCDHAIDSLKRAMKWDEEVYGREYDLNVYMIVAVDDFNMGAMENKGLNIFNTSCVLAHPKTTTDAGFQRVEAVVAHEYFHNWSGNRVTCRDWFQLSLKEGFTVFRDSEFSSDMNSRAVKRVEDVDFLTSVQFAEDSGPMAHPIQPASFIEISNFYTVTIYEKGSEVVRMVQQLLGAELFRKGCDLYFDRHDGQAATCEDFIQAMADVSGKDFTLFKRWYSQAGTPQVDVHAEYDSLAKRYTLHFAQHCPATPGQPNKAPFFIPIKLALFAGGEALKLCVDGEELGYDHVFELKDAASSISFENIQTQPVPSLLRGFSAPVKLNFDYSDDQLLELISNDTDGFNRWDAMRRLATRELMAMANGDKQVPGKRLIAAIKTLLVSESLDPAMVGLVIRLPNVAYLVEQAEQSDPVALHNARSAAVKHIAESLKPQFLNRYDQLIVRAPYSPTGEQIAQRSLRNTCLSYLSSLDDIKIAELAEHQFTLADNMTDQLAALTSLIHAEAAVYQSAKAKALSHFYRQWQHESLVVNQWLMAQATNSHTEALKDAVALMEHECFDINNPNKVRSVVSAFAANNMAFHLGDGAGYVWLADIVIQLNASNPQIASRLLTPLTRWRKYTEPYASQMKSQLQKILAAEDLSKDVYEVVSKSL